MCNQLRLLASFPIPFANAAFLVSLSEPSSVARAHIMERVLGNIVKPLSYSVVLSEQSRRFWSAFKITSFPLTSTALHCYTSHLHQIQMDICSGLKAFQAIISHVFHFL